MRQEQLEALNRIQAVEFTAVDLNLYLNTHPSDQRALTDFSDTVRELESLHAAYVARYGAPLVVTDQTGQGCWSWVTEPWPWQIEY